MKPYLRTCFWMLVLWFLSANAAMAAAQLTFHFDRQASTSVAVVQGASGTALASFPWAGALPRSYDTGDQEIDTPTLLLGHLRDLLDASADPEAPDAAQFIRTLLGPYAGTPTENLRSSLNSSISVFMVSQEWCGGSVSGGECVDPQIENVTPLCQHHACKGTKIEPE